MKLKKCLAVLTAMALTVTMFAGCGNSSEEAEVSEGPAAAVSTDGEVDFSGITLRWYYGTALSEEMATAVMADFEAETGAKVEWEGADEGATVLKARFASGEAPDVFSLTQPDIVEWQSRLADLSDQSWVDSAYASSIEQATFDGKLYAMPTSVDSCGIIYNKDYFEQAGITELPTTLDELEDVCKKLEAAGYLPFAECYLLSGFVSHTVSTVFAYEGDDLPEMEAGLADGSKTFADFKNIDNFFRYLDMTLEYGKGKDSISYSIDDQIADFANGKMAMIKQGTWLGQALSGANPDLNMGLMAIPLTDNSEDCKLMQTTGNFLGVNKESENLEASLYFLQWLHDNAQKYSVEIESVAAPFEGLDFSGMNALFQDASVYAENGQTFAGFGWENWPAGYTEDVLAPIQAYAAGQADKEATEQALTEAYVNRSK